MFIGTKNFVLIAAVLFASAVSAVIMTNNEDIFFIGTVENKSFFGANKTQASWWAAKDFCRNMSMQLASITSPAQSELLRSSYDNVTFKANYWTSGRDSQTINQFSWDADGSGASSSGLEFINNHSFEVMSCLVYLSNPVNASLRLRPCNSSSEYVLCHTESKQLSYQLNL